MRSIQRLTHDQIPEYVRIVAYAFPEWGLIPTDKREKLITHLQATQDLDTTINLFGLFEDKRLLGGYRLHEFSVNHFGKQVAATGIGLVAVSMEDKKRKVCRDMLLDYLVRSRNAGALYAMLYPFRPDFYHKMGFGWGARMHVYSVTPQQLPNWPDAERAVLCSEEDIPALRAFYEEYATRQHGAVGVKGWDSDRFFKGAHIVAAVKRGEEVAGYVSFKFRSVDTANNMMTKDIDVAHIVWRDLPAMRALLQFLRLQSDQCRYILLGLHDDAFSYLLDDPRHSDNSVIFPVFHMNARTGVGWMTRVINTEQALLARPWGDGDLTVRFEIADNFLSSNDSPVTVRFSGGEASITDAAPEVALACRMCDFAPLMVNATTLAKLHALGLISLSDDSYLPQLATLFRRDETPECIAMF